MNKDLIEICGVTPSCDFPKFGPDYPCTEISDTDNLCIPCKKPDIKDILQIWVSVSICSIKTLCTPVGKKLVINGIKHVKIMYVANNSCETVHCAHFEIPFCSFILLKHWCSKIIDICTAVEHVCIHKHNSRCFCLSTIIFICPIFKKKCNCSNQGEKKHHCNEDCIFTSIDMCDNDSNKNHLDFCCEKEEDICDHNNYLVNCYDDNCNEDCCNDRNDFYYFSNCHDECCPKPKHRLNKHGY